MLICGVGGQGNLLLERIIGLSAVRAGLPVKAADTFGAAQRGGSVLSHLRIGTEVVSSLVAQRSCHLLVGLEPGEALKVAEEYLAPEGLGIVNTAPILPARVKAGLNTYPAVAEIMAALERVAGRIVSLEATALARKTAGTPRAMNMVMLGVLAGLEQLPIATELLEQIIQETTGRLAEGNLRAFRAGREVGEKKKPELGVPPVWRWADA
ncbi:MAG: indolepyruvate oxidoreductase subunit beta [Thermodesulfobacteriota bacterium]